jgi:hypothetical protein
MNDAGTSNPSVFADKVLAIDKITSLEDRVNACKSVTKAANETNVLTYLVRCPYWEELVSVCKLPLYRTLQYRTMMKLRTRSVDAPVRLSHHRF